MLKNINSVAPAAKIRVLYGRRLTPAAFGEMLKMSGLPEITAYLKSHPAYGKLLSGLDPSLMHRGYLEGIIQKDFFTQQIKIAKSACGSDRAFLETIISRYEINELLSFMRYLKSGRQKQFLFSVPEYIYKYSRLDFKGFADCADYREFCKRLEGTPYYKVLSVYRFEIDSDLSEFENLLFTDFYSRQLGIVGKFDNRTKNLVGAALGSAIDILNVAHILRLKKYYGLVGNDAMCHVIPFYYRISERQMRELAAMPYGEAEQMLIKTSYGKLFGDSCPFPEMYLDKFIFKFSKRIMSGTFSTVLVPIAYFNLKDIETRDLITLVEGKRYGLSEDEIRKNLIGV